MIWQNLLHMSLLQRKILIMQFCVRTQFPPIYNVRKIWTTILLKSLRKRANIRPLLLTARAWEVANMQFCGNGPTGLFVGLSWGSQGATKQAVLFMDHTNNMIYYHRRLSILPSLMNTPKAKSMLKGKATAKAKKEVFIKNMPGKHNRAKTRPFQSDSSCESALAGERKNIFENREPTRGFNKKSNYHKFLSKKGALG